MVWTWKGCVKLIREKSCHVILLQGENKFVHMDRKPSGTTLCLLLTEVPLFKLIISKSLWVPGATTFAIIRMTEPWAHWALFLLWASALTSPSVHSWPPHLCLPKNPPGITPSPLLTKKVEIPRPRLFVLTLIHNAVNPIIIGPSLSSLCNHSPFPSAHSPPPQVHCAPTSLVSLWLPQHSRHTPQHLCACSFFCLEHFLLKSLLGFLPHLFEVSVQRSHCLRGHPWW